MTRIEAFRVSLPLVHSFATSSHRKDFLEHILVRYEGADGVVGWGEIASGSDPYYCPETVDTCWFVLQHYLAPALLGHSWEHPDEAAASWGRVRGHHFAKAGLEMACWDAYARRRGEAVGALLGGEATSTTAGVSLGIEPTISDLLQRVDGHLEEGYRRVKLKIAPGWDEEPVRAVREAHPDLTLQVDANGAYRETDEHLRALRALDGFDLLLLEQPFAPGAIAAHARLQGELATSLCLDESVEDLDHLDTAITLGAARVLNIKVSRMGGLSPAAVAHHRAVDAGWQVWCGGMHEFGVGRAANLALSALPGFTLPSDVSGSDKYYRQDVVQPPIRAVDGVVQIPLSRPGLGFEPDESLIRSLSGDRIELTV